MALLDQLLKILRGAKEDEEEQVNALFQGRPVFRRPPQEQGNALFQGRPVIRPNMPQGNTVFRGQVVPGRDGTTRSQVNTISPEGNVIPARGGSGQPEEDTTDPLLQQRAAAFRPGASRGARIRPAAARPQAVPDTRTARERFADTVTRPQDLVPGQPGVAQQAAQFQKELREEALSLALARAKDIRSGRKQASPHRAVNVNLSQISGSQFARGSFRPKIDPAQEEGQKVGLALQVLESFDKPPVVSGRPTIIRRKAPFDKNDLAETRALVQKAIKGNKTPGGGQREQSNVLDQQIMEELLIPFLNRNPELREQLGGPFGRQKLLDFFARRG